MLHAICGHVKSKTKDKRIVESIRYRNLAPLYCDEKMRICGTLRNWQPDGDTYDVWIEGPTGGVAVKGTVRTVLKPQYKRSDLKKTKPSRQPNSGSKKSVVRKDSIRETVHASQKNGRDVNTGAAASPESDLNVALGWSDETAPSSNDGLDTSVQHPTSLSQDDADNRSTRHMSPKRATEGDSRYIFTPLKFSPLLKHPTASGDDAPLVNSIANKHDPLADQSPTHKARYPRRPWRHVHSPRKERSRKKFAVQETVSVQKKSLAQENFSVEKAKALVKRIPSTPQHTGTVPSAIQRVTKRNRADRNARQPTEYALHKDPLARSYRPSTYHRRGVRFVMKLCIRSVGEVRTPPPTTPARYGLSRKRLRRVMSQQKRMKSAASDLGH